MIDLTTNSKDFLQNKLGPYLARVFPEIKVKYQNFQLMDNYWVHEYFVKGPKLDWIGLEPVALREADQDDVKRIAEFLYKIGTGKLHPSCWQYLMGPITQRMIKSGERKGFGKFRDLGQQKEAEKPSDALEKNFEIGVKMDNEVKAVAAKRNFDETWERGILAERPHLLDPSKGDAK